MGTIIADGLILCIRYTLGSKARGGHDNTATVAGNVYQNKGTDQCADNNTPPLCPISEIAMIGMQTKCADNNTLLFVHNRSQYRTDQCADNNTLVVARSWKCIYQNNKGTDQCADNNTPPLCPISEIAMIGTQTKCADNNTLLLCPQ